MLNVGGHSYRWFHCQLPNMESVEGLLVAWRESPEDCLRDYFNYQGPEVSYQPAVPANANNTIKDLSDLGL